MPAPLRISAKTLGSLALPDFCPRCFWIQLRVEGKLPFQTFPGIFNSIDAYSKRLVESWFERHGCPPEWLAHLGEIARREKPPHYSKFYTLDEPSSVVVRGTPDEILMMKNKSYAIVDYKTAKFTATQDELLPMYDAQLNAYAYIGEQRGFSPVSKLALIYTEPLTDDAAASEERNMSGDGFAMNFRANLLPVQLNLAFVPQLMRKARKIYDSKRPPKGRERCKNCESLGRLIEVAVS